MSDSPRGVKSAYELALERIEGEGIEKPRADALTAQAREEIKELRARAQGQLAELEILHRDSRTATSPEDQEKVEKNYVAERQRIESKLERDIERLRGTR